MAGKDRSGGKSSRNSGKNFHGPIDLGHSRVHIAGMFTKKPETPRKSLRERVADRQAGRAEEPVRSKASSFLSRKWIMRTANLFQGIGILIMLFVVWRFTDGNIEYMEELIGIAAGFFLTGRVAIIVVKTG
jgi:hypothetical protein